jgi:hypothetical protein
MVCTACKSHFHWESGRLLKSSSNHHYDNVASFAINITKRGLEESDGICEDDRGPALFEDHIPRDIFEESVDDRELMSILYDDPVVVRMTKKTKYMEKRRPSYFKKA